MRGIIVILIVLIFQLDLNAQNQIKGKIIVEDIDGVHVPIPGANIYWKGTSIGTASNIEGSYFLLEPESYPDTLIVSFVGYQKFFQVIRGLGYYDIKLVPLELNEVKVESKINTITFSTIETKNTQILSVGELQKAACCNLSESFNTNSTVDVVFTDAVSGAKQIKMLGLDGVYTQITQENIPVLRGLSSSYGIQYVPGTWIESIQIIKGSGSVVNGYQSLTGQINLEYLKPLPNTPKFYWNVHTNQEGKIENNIHLVKRNGNWKSNLFAHILYFNEEIDHHGSYHDHSDHSDHLGDGFMDVPKTKQFNVFNRWQNIGNKKYNMTITARGLVEDRVGGTIKGVLNPYIVDIQNNVIEFTTKNGFVKSVKIGRSIGLQTSIKRHEQKMQFGANMYSGLQESIYINLIRQISSLNIDQNLKYGFSYYADRYTESFTGNIDLDFNDNTDFNSMKRVDLISGIFSEYSYTSANNLTIIAGIRADYYNQNRTVTYLPRINMKYNFGEQTTFRLSAGKASRIANVFVENASFLASSRKISVREDLSPELAWSYGVNLVHCFKFLSKEGTINIDYYQTVFDNQVIVDVEDQGKLSFYNLIGESFSSVVQFDLSYELFPRFDIRLGYKLNDVQKTFGDNKKRAPLTPEKRALLNLSYATNFEKWKFDFTTNYIGRSRVPIHEGLMSHSQLSSDNFSDPFYIFNAQITKRFKRFDVYLGGENLGGYLQDNPIISSLEPQSDIFDASLVWAPIHARMLYVGLRYKLK